MIWWKYWLEFRKEKNKVLGRQVVGEVSFCQRFPKKCRNIKSENIKLNEVAY